MALVLCMSCSRHVRFGSNRCPFCEAYLPATYPLSAPRGRMSRAAMVFGAMAVSVGAAACSKETSTVAAAYGAAPPPSDAQSPTMPAREPDSVDAGVAPIAPPRDAGRTSAVAKPYGAPPGPDSDDFGPALPSHRSPPPAAGPKKH